MGSWFLFPRTRLVTLSAILTLETHIHFVLRWNQQTPHVKESQDKAYLNIGCETSHPFFIFLKGERNKNCWCNKAVNPDCYVRLQYYSSCEHFQ